MCVNAFVNIYIYIKCIYNIIGEGHLYGGGGGGGDKDEDTAVFWVSCRPRASQSYVIYSGPTEVIIIRARGLLSLCPFFIFLEKINKQTNNTYYARWWTRQITAVAVVLPLQVLAVGPRPSRVRIHVIRGVYALVHDPYNMFYLVQLYVYRLLLAEHGVFPIRLYWLGVRRVLFASVVVRQDCTVLFYFARVVCVSLRNQRETDRRLRDYVVSYSVLVDKSIVKK